MNEDSGSVDRNDADAPRPATPSGASDAPLEWTQAAGSPWAGPREGSSMGVPLSWPGSPYDTAGTGGAGSYGAPQQPTVIHHHHGPSRGKLAVAAAILTIVSVSATALVVGSLDSRSSSPVATSLENGSGSSGHGSAGGTSGGTSNVGGGSSSSSSSLSTSQIATAVTKGVVDITTTLGYQDASAAGTGMVLTSNGEILTNNHVIKGATSIRVTVVTTGRTYDASVVGTDPTDDVAVLQLQNASGLSTIPIGNSSTVQVGDAVVAIGNAGGTGGTPSVVTGSVTALGRTITASDQNGSNAEQLSGLIQVDAPIVAGDSGGPLANSSGKVIGMDTAASTTQARFTGSAGTSEGYAIPISSALEIAKKIESGQETSTIHIGLPGFLGVEVQDASSSSSQGGFGGFGGFGGLGGSAGGSTSTVPGALVSGTTSGSPAAAAGITAGDVITSLNGSTVDSASTLTSLLVGHHKGDQVTVGWTDSSGQSHTATITLAQGPAD